jgi:hypothetical protein
MAMGIDLSTLPRWIYYQNEDQLDPASSNKVNKLRLGIKVILILVSVRTQWWGKSKATTQDIKEKFGLMNFDWQIWTTKVVWQRC